MSRLHFGLTLAGLIVLAGCAAPIEEPERAGFLSDYSKLELVDDDHLSYVGDRMGEFDSFIIDPVQAYLLFPLLLMLTVSITTVISIVGIKDTSIIKMITE